MSQGASADHRRTPPMAQGLWVCVFRVSIFKHFQTHIEVRLNAVC